METRLLRYELKDLTTEGDNAGHFAGYASTRKKDVYGDIVSEGAFSHTIKMNEGKVPLLWFHDPRTPIGMTTLMQEDGHGLYMEGQLDLDIEPGRRVLSGMRRGYIDRQSIGFRAVKEDYDGDIRLIKEVELLEISPVSRNFAANDEALITSVKSSDLTSLAEEIKRLTAVLTNSDPGSSSRQRGDPPHVADPTIVSLQQRLAEIQALHKEMN